MRSLPCLGLVAAMTLAQTQCDNPFDKHAEQPESPRPTVPALMAGHEPELPEVPIEPTAQPQAAYVLERWVLPLQRSMEPAWAMVDESVIPPHKRELLHKNGLRIGLLDLSNIRAFDQATGKRLVVTRQKILGSTRVDRLIRMPMLGREALVQLSLPPDMPQVYEAREGAVQILHQAVRESGNTVTLRLLPHHHLPKVTIRPRHHLETEFDGRLFESLMTTLTPGPNRLVVLGLYWPWQLRETHEPGYEPLPPLPPKPTPQTPKSPEPPDESEDSKSQDKLTPPTQGQEQAPTEPAAQTTPTEDESSNTPEETPEPDPPEPTTLTWRHPKNLPPTLGRMLFTGVQAGRPAQILLLLRVQSLPQQPPPDDAPSSEQPAEP